MLLFSSHYNIFLKKIIFNLLKNEKIKYIFLIFLLNDFFMKCFQDIFELLNNKKNIFRSIIF